MREDIKLWIKQFALESTGIHIDETISLLDPRNGLMPRDLIVLFFELQKHYKIKFVEQDIIANRFDYFNDTIRNNICLYKQIDDTVIEAACKDSGLEDFIKEVSLDHVVGQNGAMLSGGQKQKIALARALVHDKPIIIFDEATSNTDAYSEQQINGLLDTRLKDKTVIVITHKKEILSKVDQIVVLKEGVVADLGRYDDLIGKSDELNVMLEKAE